jgi:hypothetical protein
MKDRPRLVHKRFQKFRRMVRTQLKIVDATEGGTTIQGIEQVLLQERDRGFHADALIIDYDDEIVPTRKQKERRFEFADIYRDLRQMTARYNLLSWIAAQTRRGTEENKVIGGDLLAEDISKLRKVALAIGIGKGEWGENSLYLWVAKHKYDVQHVGCNIISDYSRMLIYDPEATRRAAAEHGSAPDEEESF